MKRWLPTQAWAFGFCLFLTGCLGRAGYETPAPGPSPAPETSPACHLRLKTLGYTIQIGAFSRQDFAVRLEKKLKHQGLDAFYFLHDDGLYKVRTGNYQNYANARSVAQSLRSRGTIEEFFIVRPEDYSVARAPVSDCRPLREEIIRTANRFIGVPYQWGGESVEEGFDCSGLTMVVYRLNGLDLPRVSYHQFDAGRPVSAGELRKGDLVFFATRARNRVSHVGIYLGGGRFIHAPRRGDKVKVSNLSSGYYAERFMGGRTYL